MRNCLRRFLPVAILTLAGFLTGVFQPVSAEDVSEFQRQIAASNPVARWSFSDSDELNHGGRLENGPQTPQHSGFSKSNQGLSLKNGERIVVPDEGTGSRFDFDQGDQFSVEAMVNPTELKGFATILSKGRTANAGFPSDNQNWAFRLTSVGGNAGVNFLFRSRTGRDGAGDWHRWTSNEGFVVGSGWHHVALCYTFGKPESLRAYIDGKNVTGKWDMGGATTKPPVVDDDEIWLGSTMGGNVSNSFHGVLDEVALYRQMIPDEVFKSRFKYVPPPLVLPEPTRGVLQVNIHGPLSSDQSFPNDPGEPLASWQQPELGFLRLPRRYDDWGVREDWGTAVMVRAVTEIELEPGDFEFLIRSRAATRLFIDGEQLVFLPRQKRGGGAHNKVKPIPEVLRSGMRPPAMDDVEKVVPFSSAGGRHVVVMDVMVGGPRLRLDFGEPCVAISNGTNMFRLLTPEKQTGSPLTDDGWLDFVDRLGDELDAMDVERRRSADRQQDYWNQRHRHAAEKLPERQEHDSIDRLVGQRRANARNSAGNPQSFFNQQVRPVFAEHCYRCHGDKEKGDLNLLSQKNLFAGGESGEAAVIPGKPEESHLIELVTSESGDRMPPQGEGLSEQQVGVLREWIDRGAELEPAPVDIGDERPLIDDLTFLRRVLFDLVGVSPPVSVIHEFLANQSSSKRAEMIDRLLEDERWADNWVGYWQDVLAENPNLLKPMLNNTGPFRYWILESFRDNKPMDRFATELITMRGSIWGGGAGGFGIATQNDVPMAAKAHIIGTAFLGVDMKCARCHDAPYHETTQETLFQLAAMLDRKAIKVPATSSVPAAFFDHLNDGGREPLIDVTLKIGAKVNPNWPFVSVGQDGVDQLSDEEKKDSRLLLAAKVTRSRRFAEVIVNRVWKRLMGAGLVEPVDDWEGHPPSDPDLLEFLADEFIRGGYDLRRLTSQIMNSRIYQCEAQDMPSNLVESERFFEGPYRRRLMAEQIVDNAWHAAGREMDLGYLTMDIEGRLAPNYFMNFGQPKHAWEFTTMANERDRPSLAMPKIQAVVDALRAFGWRNSRQEPTSNRMEEPNPLQPGVLANGVMGSWLTQLTDDSGLTRVCVEVDTVDDLVETLFLRFLTRYPSEDEKQRFTDLLKPGFNDRVVPREAWGPVVQIERMPHVSWSNHLDSAANLIKQKQEELARKGDPPTRYLRSDWRERAEDAVWALMNAPEMILVP